MPILAVGPFNPATVAQAIYDNDEVRVRVLDEAHGKYPACRGAQSAAAAEFIVERFEAEYAVHDKFAEEEWVEIRAKLLEVVREGLEAVPAGEASKAPNGDDAPRDADS